MLSQEVIRRYLSVIQAMTPMPGGRGGEQMEVAKGRRGKSGTGWRGLASYHTEDIYMAAVASQTLRVVDLSGTSLVSRNGERAGSAIMPASELFNRIP